MPIYEYVCKDCGTRFEAIRSMKEADAPIHCKNCLGTQTQRALSTFFASSGGKSVAGCGGGCGSCSGGSCGSCSCSH